MSSTLRIDASRANGARSTGPVTPEGKEASAANSALSTGPSTPQGKSASSQNAIRHGALAQSVLIPGECADGFLELLARLRHTFQPSDHVEDRCVEIMAVADWRRSRLWCFEMAQLTHASHLQARAADPLADHENRQVPVMHAALAFSSLGNNSRTLDVEEIRARRDAQRDSADQGISEKA